MAKVDCTELEKAISDLALSIGAQEGVETLDDVVAEIQKSFPIMLRDEIVNSIVNATATQTREVGEISKKLTAIKNEARRESEPRRKAALEKQIAEYERRIEEGDLLREKLPEVPQSKELERLAYQRDQLRHKVRAAVQALKPKSVWERIADPFNAVRALITSFDFSAVFRQGGFIAFGHPIRAAEALPAMFEALSAQKAEAINAEILNRPNAPLYARAKLYLAPTDGSEALAAREEAFMTRLAAKIPGVGASQRVYVTFLNVLRADSFDAMAESFTATGEPTLQEAQALANYINEATGRGPLGSLERASVALNTVFFAPKYTASRFQLLVGHPLWQPVAMGLKGQGWTPAKLIAGEYARYLAGLAVFYALASLAGGDPEDDPHSSDFGKVKFGNSRIDPLSGLSQTAVLIDRLVTGETKSSITGKIAPIRGPNVPYAGTTTPDVVARFLRAKLSPTLGIPLDIASGKNVVGEPVTPTNVLARAIVPMQFSDIYDTMKEQGVPEATALGMLSVFGMGLQTYGPRKKQ